MCERTCPTTVFDQNDKIGRKCGSTDHIELYGLIGSHIVCNDCGTILANQRDIEAAPTNLTEAEANAWANAGTFVLPGAEAADPADDEFYRRTP